MFRILLTILLLSGAACYAADGVDDLVKQPITIDAEAIEVDFANGRRIYRGNATVQQGQSMLLCDELIAQANATHDFAEIICTGTPARFIQQGSSAKPDTVATARQITRYYVRAEVLLSGEANFHQGRHQLSGARIIYDLQSEQATVSQPAVGGANATPVRRAKLVIQPKVAED